MIKMKYPNTKIFTSYVTNMTCKKAQTVNNTWLTYVLQLSNCSLNDTAFTSGYSFNALSLARSNLKGLIKLKNDINNSFKITAKHAEAVRNYNLNSFYQPVALTLISYTDDGNVKEHNVMTSNSPTNTIWYEVLPWSGYDNNKSLPFIAQCNKTCPFGYGVRDVDWNSVFKFTGKTQKSWKCEKCSKKYRTPCKSFTNDVLTFADMAFYVAITLSVLGVCATAVTIVIFLRFSSTPFVRASNKNMSLLQLMAHMFFFLAPLSYFIEPSELLCILRPIAIGIFLTFIMAITLMKTQKLVFIFQAQIRVSRKQVQMSKTMECTLVLLMLCVQVCIAVLSFSVNTIRLNDEYIIETRKHIYECNTGEESLIQMMFGFLLVLMCMMQAFRARKLPENFNETKYIVLAMFLCTLTVAVLLPLRFYLSSSKEKVANDVFMLLVANFILLFVMYGYKCWIIVFQPERNTSSAFKQNISQY
ncbi:extracellular calcium-sensing receptor-like [Hydractinia symbiolongicarpus]|uniref:extracellular calcium-sensing receptor-like n=1 Tax=Hydractinia symbiolongicarpus TaxID=13093 RepID=UPI00254CE38C|nr:extracellular calcium-sensing receptor-like [Hydractinia symbiolongicarpus]